MSEAETKRILRLPGGREIPVPDGMTAEQMYWQHAAMSLPEGLCPHHQTPLSPVEVRDGADVVVAGHCATCAKFWSLTRAQATAWDVDHDPHDGNPMYPDWMAGCARQP
jgi:hypothetical protein